MFHNEELHDSYRTVNIAVKVKKKSIMAGHICIRTWTEKEKHTEFEKEAFRKVDTDIGG
jgi:hypothetical protein